MCIGVKRALTRRQPSPHFSFILFCYFCSDFTFQKLCFLQGFLPRRVNSHLSEFDIEKLSFRVENLAQARQMALKRVLRRKI